MQNVFLWFLRGAEGTTDQKGGKNDRERRVLPSSDGAAQQPTFPAIPPHKCRSIFLFSFENIYVYI